MPMLAQRKRLIVSTSKTSVVKHVLRHNEWCTDKLQNAWVVAGSKSLAPCYHDMLS